MAMLFHSHPHLCPTSPSDEFPTANLFSGFAYVIIRDKFYNILLWPNEFLLCTLCLPSTTNTQATTAEWLATRLRPGSSPLQTIPLSIYILFLLPHLTPTQIPNCVCSGWSLCIGKRPLVSKVGNLIKWKPSHYEPGERPSGSTRTMVAMIAMQKRWRFKKCALLIYISAHISHLFYANNIQNYYDDLQITSVRIISPSAVI